MGNNRKHIPVEIIDQILYNLPVKSLLRFKCVSKSWLSMITNKDFVKRHLKKSSADPRFTHHKIIVKSHDKSTNYYNLGSCSLGYLYEETYEKNPRTQILIDRPLAKWCFDFRILGACNGLVLMFAETGHLFLWNPTTTDAKHIPSVYFDGRCDSSVREFMYGFAYDEANDDYKVVCFYLHSKPFQTKMYSLKGNSWKKIDNFEKGSPGCRSGAGKLVNGKLHWLATDSRRGWGWWDIVSFNFSDEKFEIEPCPRQYMSNYGRNIPKLVTLGGYLGLICPERQKGTSVWVMIEYGDAESWTRVWTTKSSGYGELWVTKNGDIAVAYGSYIVVYNGRKKLRQFRIDMVGANFVPDVYVESLVSPSTH
ncbi:hypothetical protein ABFX02_14G033700 [Erythranthe guttata]